MNHPGRGTYARFELFIRCDGMGEDWRLEVGEVLTNLAPLMTYALAEGGDVYDLHNVRVGTWRYRPAKEQQDA